MKQELLILSFSQTLYAEFRKEILQSKLIMVEGQLQVQGEVIHVIVNQCYNFSKWLRQFTPSNKETAQVLAPANYNDPDSYQNIAAGQNKGNQVRESEQEKVFSKARNFR